MYALDADYSAKVDQARQDFRTKMAKVDTDYLASWDAGRRPEEDASAALSTAEKDWVSCTLGMYDFAGERRHEIEFRNGSLNYTSPEVRTDFLSRVSRCQALQGTMSDMRNKALARQNARALPNR